MGLYTVCVSLAYSVVDECHHRNGGCAQICHDTPTSYFCSCRHGYKINPDQRTCDGQYKMIMCVAPYEPHVIIIRC